ncbi:MAG: hypothetical protein SFV51_08870 [Bryobacteraceae bacterium]|nr:hypothetical protein [Bryobacteraceae bacterium]
MALLVDGSSPSVEELQRYEAGVIEMANTEGIDLGAKASIAREQIVTELIELLNRNSDGQGQSVMGRVVLTEPLRRWLVMGALAAVYGEGRLSQVSERYAGKWADFARLAGEAKQWLVRAGIGVAGAPLRRPGAPELTVLEGSAPAGSYFFRYTWAAVGGQESEAGDMAVVTLSAPGGVRLTPGAAPTGAVGWNVFAGEVESELAMQNGAPIAIDEPWEWNSGNLDAGRPPSGGQAPDSYVRVPNVLLRG